MRVLIVGYLGMLGADLMVEFGRSHDVLGLDRDEIDIRDLRQCLARAEEFHPDVIMNAAALTQVDFCETHEEEALLVNGEGAGNLSKAASSVDSLIVHYSTDYVFDGRKNHPYLEEDSPNPLSVYGKSKLLGEALVRRYCSNHLILRTSWLFGRNGMNFIRTVLGLAREGRPLRVVDDQKGSPSYAGDLAAQTLRMVEADCKSTYHVTNSGFCSWYELAEKTVRWAEIEGITITPVSTAEFPRPAPRPANSVLANARLEREGLPLMRPWEIAVREYVSLL